MRALITNDDGVHSEGLRALAEAATHHGLEVTVVAPSFDASGSSASMTARAESGRVAVEPQPPGSSGTDTATMVMLGVQGPPAFIVRAAMYGAFGPAPDVVLSGVNRGLNTGRAILHSGTVGAALTAATYGRRALALSAGVEEDDTWQPAHPCIDEALGWLLRSPEGTVLNVNLPAGRHGRPTEARATSLAAAGRVQGRVVEADQYVPVTFGDSGGPPAPGSDEAALADGFVSVTAIRAVVEDTTFDVRQLLDL